MTTQTTKQTRPQNEALAVRPLTAEVRSETDPAKAYTVTLPYCPCRDFFYRRGNLSGGLEGLLCNHLRAALGLVGAPSRDVSRLDEATAVELLGSFGVSQRAADAALGRAQVHVQGSIALPDGRGILVITYNRNADTYDVQLPTG
jgi:hypothetical protein